MASAERPNFMSAMPRACHPSKNAGSSSTQRRYFSTAASSSPTARSPFASSKSSSTAEDMARQSGLDRGWLLLLQARGVSPVVQPFVEHDRALALEIIFLE